MPIRKFPIIWKLGLHILVAGLLVIFLLILHIAGEYSATNDAVAINLAGSERMRSLKIAMLLRGYVEEMTGNNRRLVEEEISTFEDIHNALRFGDPAYKLKAAGTAESGEQLDRSMVVWNGRVKPVLTGVLGAPDKGAAREILSRSGLEEEVFAYAKVMDGAVKLIEESSLRKTRTIRLWSYYVISLMAMTALSSFIFIYKSITSRIKSLISAADIIASGDLSHRVSIDTRDEIGDLGRSFNAMAGRLEESRKALLEKETLAALGTFSAGMAHEIRNPLSSIMMNLNILYKMCPDKAVYGRHFRLALGEADHLDRILKDVLDFSKPDKLRLSSKAIPDIIDASLHMASKEITEKEIEVVKDIGVIPPVAIDAMKIKQALLNIYLNSIHAMERGGTLGIKAFLRDDDLVIIIEDNGKGMDRDVGSRIFEPFFTTRSGGTGLGMPLAKKAVEQHNGSIDIETAPGKGTRTTLTLPSTGL